MKSKRVPIDEFDQTLKETVAENDEVFVLFFGTEDPDKNDESWCPDCVIADPLVRKWVGKVPNSVLLEAPVGTRSEWKLNSTHIYRINPNISLRAIPTLIRWTKNGPDGRLVEEECADQAKLEAFISTKA
ncbi:hypothetical protein K450DRAFT_233982 [Umbelopsis ramanniana AG]|uniref:Thioredoxin domain-containing protein n=1 Tax=Umbelopsis ramanniana AG TaxID=1314678 RepID=A0AAD5HGE1_UMBRA|nr:uncharacterized protein K450DRAFT_233982 [Umbelopsis ramanniana AG]KAI8580968.1 hypothetical protein K450DRAFT_233982 [Umbelopsis ramanniana AG]